MSKMLETLNNPFRKEKARSSAQEEIAKIYLKVSDKNKKARPAPKLPWAVAAAALALVLLTLLFKSNIDVKVRIIGELPALGGERPDKFGMVSQDKGLYLLRGSEVNKYLVRDAGFAGDARTFSRAAGDELVLCNSRGSGWANYGISLKEPLDLRRLDLRYAAKGETGDECLAVTVVDSDNRTYRFERDISSRMSKEWQTITLNFKALRNAVDLANISAIRFEFGTLTAGNSSTATLFLKDICVTKTKRTGL